MWIAQIFTSPLDNFLVGNSELHFCISWLLSRNIFVTKKDFSSDFYLCFLFTSYQWTFKWIKKEKKVTLHCSLITSVLYLPKLIKLSSLKIMLLVNLKSTEHKCRWDTRLWHTLLRGRGSQSSHMYFSSVPVTPMQSACCHFRHSSHWIIKPSSL